MPQRRVLVVTTFPATERVVRETVRDAGGEGDVEVRVVAPAVNVSRLEWLANDEDDARRDAVDAGERTAGAVGSEADAVEVGVGEADPANAIDAALREFPADEVVVVTRPDERASWLEEGAADEARERFGVPVRHVVEETA